jgi:hypothetical protein
MVQRVVEKLLRADAGVDIGSNKRFARPTEEGADERATR